MEYMLVLLVYYYIGIHVSIISVTTPFPVHEIAANVCFECN